MRKVLLTLFGLLVLIVAGALAAPSFVNWNAYKDDISQVVRAQTGRDLEIQGDIRATLLPSPELSAENIRLSNRDGASSEDMVSLAAVRVRVAIVPLLSRIIRVDSFELVEPIVEIEKLADGSMNFDDLVTAGDNAAAAPAADAPAATGGDAAEGAMNVGGFDVRLDSATIRNGTVIYRDSQAGSLQVIEDFNLTVGANSLAGPFELAGDINLAGIPFDFEAGLGRIERDRSAVPLTLSVGIDSGATRGNFTGAVIGLTGDDPGIRGKLKGRSENILKLLAALGMDISALPAELAKPLTLDAAVQGSAKGGKVEEILLEAAGSRIAGSAEVKIADVIEGALDLHVGSLDLDALLASVPGQTGAAANAEAASGDSAAPAQKAAAPQAAAKGSMEAPSLPADVNFAANFTADAVVYRGKPVNRLNISVALANGELSINQVSAQLPGATDVTLFGFLAPSGKTLAIDLEADTRSENLRNLLDWAGVDLSGIPQGRLQTLALRTKVGGTIEQIQISEFEAKLDSTTIRAAATMRPSPRPGLGLTLRVDKLDLDGYLPAQAAEPAKAKAPAAAAPAGDGSAPAASPAQADPFAALGALNDFDINADVAIGSLIHQGIAANDIVLKAQLLRGQLDVREATIGNLAGARASLKGGFSGFGGKAKIAGMEATLAAKSIDGLLRLAGIDSPIPPEKLGAIQASLAANGGLDRLAINTRLNAAGATASAAGDIAPLGAADDLNLAVKFDHPSLNNLLAIVAPDYRPTDRKLGPLAVKADLGVKPSAISVNNLNAKVGPTAVSGSASIRTDGPRPMITARLQADELPAASFVPLAPGGAKGSGSGAASSSSGGSAPAPASGTRWSREKLDTSGLRAVDADIQIAAKAVLYEQYRVDNPEIVLTLKDGRLDLSRMAGKMFGGGFDMTAVAIAGERLNAETRVVVENANIKQAVLQTAGMDVADGTLGFTADLKTSGASQYDLVRGLNGVAKLGVTDGVVNGFDLDTLSDRLNDIGNVASLLSLVTQGIQGGQTKFQNLSGNFRVTNGVVETNDLTVTARSGIASTAAKADLADWTMNGQSKVQLTRINGAPPIGVRFSGPLDSPNPTFDINALQAFLIANGLVKGVGGIVKGGKDIVKGAGDGVGGLVKGVLGTLGGQGNQNQTAPSGSTSSGNTSSGSTPPPPPPQQQQPSNPLNKLLKGVLGN